MAFIICDRHGGNVASLVSNKVAEFISSGKVSEKFKKIKFKDEQGRLYTSVVDNEFFLNLEENLGFSLSQPITDESLYFEISLDLVPVCSVCLRDFLDRYASGE